MEGHAQRGGEAGIAIESPLVIAAHELKSPLAILRQLSLELQTDISERDRLLIAQHAQLVSESALRLTSNLTRASRLQTELFVSEPLSPSRVCAEVVREITPLYKAYDRKLSVHISRSVNLALANHDLLRRIVLTFCDNALYYADESSVVRLYAQLVSDRVRIGVRDEGPALTKRAWKALSENNPQYIEAGRPQSSGLGLIIAHRFADAMDGRIGAIRHRDGATFYVELPVSNQLSLA